MQINDFLLKIKDRFKKIPNNDNRSKIGTRDLVTTLVFCFSRDRGNYKSLSCIKKFVQATLNVPLSRGGFWERLATKKLEKTFEKLVASMVKIFAKKLTITIELLKILNVNAILLLDSSSSSLPKSAKRNFPAPRNNVAPAAIKLHLCFDLFAGAVNWFLLTPATTHDRKGFPPLQSIVGKLIIFDLGYWDYGLLNDIKKIGGFFLTRVKNKAHIKIIEVIRGLPKKQFTNWGLFDRKLPDKNNKIIEILGQFSQNSKPLFTARIIGFWNPIKQRYHWYTTNLTVSADFIYPLYRLRWQVELVFKAFKGCLRLADLPTANSKIIHVLIYAAIVATMIAHPIANILALEFKKEKLMTPSLQRAGMILVHCAKEFIQFLISKINSCAGLIDKLKLLKNEIFDPNWKKRETSLARLIRMADSCV